MCVMDFGFIGGSMGAVVGEKVARAGEAALAERIPLIIVSSSGGARMQEGTFALMQLVKTMGVVERLKVARVPFISILTDPTTGGVFASFAVVGDVNIAEPNAIIRFAGDRVSAGTIGEELPPGYQRSEFWFSHGFVDRIVARPHLRDEIIALLGFLIAPPLNGVGEPPATPITRPRSFLSALTGALGGDGAGESRNGDSRNGEANGSRAEAPRG
jgi:acetyl-CoA carboxylase carboxyl transferase subunit beta